MTPDAKTRFYLFWFLWKNEYDTHGWFIRFFRIWTNCYRGFVRLLAVSKYLRR